jgi:hypothetical protein
VSASAQNKLQFVGSLVIFLILAALMAGLHFTFSGKIKPLHFDDPPYLRSKSYRGNYVLVAREAADVNKPYAALAAGEEVDFAQLIQSGRFFMVHNGTGISVLERGLDISKVRIREDGREGFVDSREIINE